ncbi:MAG: hypothetical protein ACLP1X_12385 [Polyangiaceae bacterium]|jgi:hypothetical protein
MKRPRLPRAVAAAAHAVLALAVLFGIVQSGGRYFYCDAFGLLPSDPCAEASRHGHSKSPLGALSEHHRDCCEVVTLAAMPQAAQAAAPMVAPAARVAIIPALWLAGRVDSAALSAIDRAFERWRPPPRASNEVRARLMVFLI